MSKAREGGKLGGCTLHGACPCPGRNLGGWRLSTQVPKVPLPPSYRRCGTSKPISLRRSSSEGRGCPSVRRSGGQPIRAAAAAEDPCRFPNRLRLAPLADDADHTTRALRYEDRECRGMCCTDAQRPFTLQYLWMFEIAEWSGWAPGDLGGYTCPMAARSTSISVHGGDQTGSKVPKKII